MNGYLLAVMGTILLAAVVTAIVPEGKTAGVVKGMTKLICLLVIVSPILKYLRSETTTNSQNDSQNFFSQSVIQTDESFIKYYSEMRIRNTEAALEKELQEEFDVACAVAISWEYDEEEIRITQICVQTQEDSGEEVKRLMWEYLTKNYCSEVLLE